MCLSQTHSVHVKLDCLPEATAASAVEHSAAFVLLLVKIQSCQLCCASSSQRSTARQIILGQSSKPRPKSIQLPRVASCSVSLAVWSRHAQQQLRALHDTFTPPICSQPAGTTTVQLHGGLAPAHNRTHKCITTSVDTGALHSRSRLGATASASIFGICGLQMPKIDAGAKGTQPPAGMTWCSVDPSTACALLRSLQPVDTIPTHQQQCAYSVIGALVPTARQS